ncbi:copper/zinc superoxide dismutase (SODC) domain-containing protein [Phthorimaea operculella]|nr:copper/zinc superoxide dismutase (SODC) domain-containing protein [Phthorimaea operculella]
MYEWIHVCLFSVVLLTGIYAEPRVAIVHLESDDISGAITFTEAEDGVRVTGTITGLPVGAYGFHIHESGDISSCIAAGAHFDLDGNNHGGRDHSQRHIGDLGNIHFLEVDGTAVANIDFVDTVISLRGRNNILGRALVLHESEDDLGLGGHETSLTTGNAGARLACGVIGIKSLGDTWDSD